MNEQPLLRVLSNEAYKKWPRSLAKENIMNELGNYSDCQNPIGQFYFWNRTRREISLSPYSILSSNSTTVLSPYLDNEIYNFLSSLPVSYYIDHSFHTETISNFYPNFSHIPYASGTNIGYSASKCKMFEIILSTNNQYLRYNNSELRYFKYYLPNFLQNLIHSDIRRIRKIINLPIYLSQLNEISRI